MRVVTNEGSGRKRVARLGEDSHILYDYKEMTDNEAEDLARKASLENPDDVFYVVHEDDANTSSSFRWINGRAYKFMMK